MTIYTAITFAPVQGFIEKSRKLRDLYGSSFLLSYLAKTICEKAREYYGVDKYNPLPEQDPIVSPAIINVTQGTPNQIIIKGNGVFDKETAKTAFDSAWREVVNSIRKFIEEALPQYQPYHWQRDWNHWANHTWEFFCSIEKNDSIEKARQEINEIKRSRNWVGINWVGESSTLSGGDAVAWYGMSDEIHPKETSMGEIDRKINQFYEELSQKLSNSIIDADEQLSIPELIKRLITLRYISEKLGLEAKNYPEVEIPQSFKDINRKKDDPEENRWTGWFQGDGDKIGDYLKSLKGDESKNLNQFSYAMMDWGKGLKYTLPKSQFDTNKLDREGRIIYAGGDDFLGVLYRNDEPKLTAQECLNWFYKFPKVWEQHDQKITVSIGFVWAAPGVPQRDVLQHCRETESLAKTNGRDRLAIRILFNSGNHLDWHCPWWFLDILKDYCDRNNVSGKDANWTHIYNDVAVLESRHAFQGNKNIALELFKIYFGAKQGEKLENIAYWWNEREPKTGKIIKTGILGEQERYSTEADKYLAITNWIINLAKVGFYLCQ
ncbi:MAG: type III-B CRISPR-associated protein Cas10/Cmr2 [Pleurocapsa sp.]